MSCLLLRAAHWSWVARTYQNLSDELLAGPFLTTFISLCFLSQNQTEPLAAILVAALRFGALGGYLILLGQAVARILSIRRQENFSSTWSVPLPSLLLPPHPQPFVKGHLTKQRVCSAGAEAWMRNSASFLACPPPRLPSRQRSPSQPKRHPSLLLPSALRRHVPDAQPFRSPPLLFGLLPFFGTGRGGRR